MKFLARLLTLALGFTFLVGLAIVGYIAYTGLNLNPAPASAPVVEFRSVELGDVVTLAVNIRADHPARAELWSENQLIARETNPNPALSYNWTVAWQWSPPGPGAFPLAVRAYDDAGRYGASALFDVVIPPHPRLLFASNRNRNQYALYSLTPDSRQAELFNLPASEDRQPAVARDQTVAFAANRAGGTFCGARSTRFRPPT